MNYSETLDFLFCQLPMFEQKGEKAYKPGLQTTLALAQRFGDPQKKLRCIHVAGTNGKGSVSSTIASVLTAAGYKTGLYTSPHLVDFGERICIDGQSIDHQFVVDFVRDWLENPVPGLHPTFFEFATVMAFCWFVRQKVDIAVIETGLGGRLDSTNIINPELCVITNISPDHTALLGKTLKEIAAEKAGIIKPGVPVVIGESDPEIETVFRDKALAVNAPIIFAEDFPVCTPVMDNSGSIIYTDSPWGHIPGELKGKCQTLNGRTIMCALAVLSEKLDITPEAVRRGFARVSKLSGLRGRWMSLSIDGIETICDTGHNVGAWQYLGPSLNDIAQQGRKVAAVLGFVNDKDLDAILQYMPHNIDYYFVKPSTERGRPAVSTADAFSSAGISGTVCASVENGVSSALKSLGKDDMLFVGGSTFVVADFLRAYGT